MAKVRTVTGDVDPDSIHGAVAAFVHLAPDWRPISDRDPEIDLPSEARLSEARSEGDRLRQVVSSIGERGIGLIVDATPPGAGRDPMRLHDLAASTGVSIVACTGAHAPPARLLRVDERSAEYLAEWFAFEIGSGMAAIAGDYFRGLPILSERAAGVAGDALNDAAVRAGAIRITLASPTIDRADGALVEAAGIAATACGVATFLDAPLGTDLGDVAARYEATGATRSRLVLAPGTRPADELLAAAALGLCVVLTTPATRSEGAVAIWEGTLRGFLRHGLLGQAIATIWDTGSPDQGQASGTAAGADSKISRVAGVEDAELLQVTHTNAQRVIAISR